MERDDILKMSLMEFEDLVMRDHGQTLPTQIVEKFGTVENLLKKTPRDLLKLPRFWTVKLHRLMELLSKYGLYLKGDSREGDADERHLPPPNKSVIEMTLDEFQRYLGRVGPKSVPRLRTLTLMALKKAKINTVKELLQYTPRRLLTIPGFKQMSLGRIREFLTENQLQLKCDRPHAFDEQFPEELSSEDVSTLIRKGEEELNAVRQTFQNHPNAHEMLLEDFNKLSQQYMPQQVPPPVSAAKENILMITTKDADYLFEPVLPNNYIIKDHKLYLSYYESMFFLCDEIYVFKDYTPDAPWPGSPWAPDYQFIYWDRLKNEYNSYALRAQVLNAELRPNIVGALIPNLFSRGFHIGQLFKDDLREALEYYLRMLIVKDLVIDRKAPAETPPANDDDEDDDY